MGAVSKRKVTYSQPMAVKKKAKAVKGIPQPNLTDTFEGLWRMHRPCDNWAEIPFGRREYQFDKSKPKPRKWRFDVVWKEAMVAVELDGGEWVRGRHHRPLGYARDAEKINAAVAAGWKVFRFTTSMLKKDGQACVEQVAEAIRAQRK